MSPPRYQDIPPSDVPVAESRGLRVRVLAGEFRGVRGPVEGIPTDPLYLDVELAPDGRMSAPMPSDHNAFVYGVEGVFRADDGPPIRAGQLAVLEGGDRLALAAENASARCLVLAARPIGEPIARYGPFVMNTEAELRQAFADLEQGVFLR
jgi:redox-sensitive bicupin YhaK (pirin superfamily)